MRTSPLAIVLSLLLLVPSFAPIGSSQPQQGDDKVNLNVDLVLLDAAVLERKTSRPVGGLKKEDFALWEDGAVQTISQFSRDSLPLSVLLLVDRGGCLDPLSEKVKNATMSALAELKPRDEVAFMAFADNVDLISEFSYDRSRIEQALDVMPPHDENANHCFNKAFYSAARYMRQAANPAGRRVIIMVTGITRWFDCNRGPTGQEARMEILESGAVVCGLIPITPEQRAENTVMGGAAGVAGVFGAKTLSLNQIADETGGEVIRARPDVLDGAFGGLIDHLRTRYTIGFISTNSKHDGTMRRLKLQVAPTSQKRLGDIVVKSRRGYLAPGPKPLPTKH